MSPIDDELRTALHRRAEALGTPDADPLPGIERRAKALRRRRAVAAVGGSTALVVALAVGIPAALGDFAAGPPDRVATQPSPMPSATAVTVAPPVARTSLDWPVRGTKDGGGFNVAEGAGKYLIGIWSTHHQRDVLGVTYRALYGTVTDGHAVVIGQFSAGGPWYTAVFVDSQLYYDEPTPAGVHEISAVIPGTAGPQVLVVAQPSGVGQLDYSPNGSGSFRPVAGGTDNVWLFPRTWDPAGQPDQIRLLDGDGDLAKPLYQGPLTYDGVVPAEPQPTPTGTPVSAGGAPVVSAWPTTGDPALLARYQSAAQVALTGQYATGPYAVDGARTIWAATLADGRADVLVTGVKKAPSPNAGIVAAVYLPGTQQLVGAHDLPAGATQVSAVVPAPAAGGTPYVVVVGAPGTGTVSYAADAKRFVPAEHMPGYRGDAQQGWATFERIGPTSSAHVDTIAVYSAGDATLRYKDMPGRGVNFPDR